MSKLGQLIEATRALAHSGPKNLYHIIKRVYEPLPEVSVTQTPHGTFSGLSNDYLFKSAVEKGINESHFSEVIAEFVKADSVCLDVGGNIGTHAIAMSRIASNGKVYTFEPQSLVFSILQNNLLLNGCSNASAFRFAISDTASKVMTMQPFSFSRERINNGAIRLDKHGHSGDLTLTRTLDSFAFPRVDFIKMDIQGSEVDALNGAEKTIGASRPIMFIEIEQQHLKALGSSAQQLIEKILSLGYALYRIENDYPCDHLCIPLELSDKFDQTIKNRFSFRLSDKIIGKRVKLTFADNQSQNYTSIAITE